MSQRGFSASFVVTGDADAAPLKDGAVVVDDDGTVVAVGEAKALRDAHPRAHFEHHRAVLLPGLVNAHTHLELSGLAGQVPGGRGFAAWADEMLQARMRVHPEQDVEAIDGAIGQLLVSGTAAVGEVSNGLTTLDALGSAPLLGRVFHEVFGMSLASAQENWAAAQQGRARVSRMPDNLTYVPAPHTVYTLHPDVLRELVAAARKTGVRTSMHLAEHAAERAFLRDGGGPFVRFLEARGIDASDYQPPGLDPVRYADALGLLGDAVMLVHLSDARPEELAIAAERGAKVVLCPRSNLHIEVKLPPLQAMLDAGLRPGLGTDSLASSPSLDVLAEARSLAQRFPSVPPRTLLAMATSWGADALGLGGQVGTLAPGLAPGVLAFQHGQELPKDPEQFVLTAPDRVREMLCRPATRYPT